MLAVSISFPKLGEVKAPNVLDLLQKTLCYLGGPTIYMHELKVI